MYGEKLELVAHLFEPKLKGQKFARDRPKLLDHIDLRLIGKRGLDNITFSFSIVSTLIVVFLQLSNVILA